MVAIQAIKRRAFLRQVAQSAIRNAQPLKEALLAVQLGQFSPNVQRGRLLTATSGSGQSGSFEVWSLGKEFTQDNVIALVEQLIEVCESVISTNSYTDDGSEANTTLIFNSMMQDDSLQGASQGGSDYTLIGWYNNYGGGYIAQ